MSAIDESERPISAYPFRKEAPTAEIGDNNDVFESDTFDAGCEGRKTVCQRQGFTADSSRAEKSLQTLFELQCSDANSPS